MTIVFGLLIVIAFFFFIKGKRQHIADALIRGLKEQKPRPMIDVSSVGQAPMQMLEVPEKTNTRFVRVCGAYSRRSKQAPRIDIYA